MTLPISAKGDLSMCAKNLPDCRHHYQDTCLHPMFDEMDEYERTRFLNSPVSCRLYQRDQETGNAVIEVLAGRT